MPTFTVSHDNRVIGCDAGLSTPPAEPDLQLSKHPALQGSSLLPGRYRPVRTPLMFGFQRLNFIRLQPCYLRADSPLASFAMWTAFPPSDYYEASDSSHRSTGDCYPPGRKSLTFMLLNSTKEFRWRLSKQPNRISRLLIRKWVCSGCPFHPFGWTA